VPVVIGNFGLIDNDTPQEAYTQYQQNVRDLRPPNRPERISRWSVATDYIGVQCHRPRVLVSGPCDIRPWAPRGR
jgi:hypothetical protein